MNDMDPSKRMSTRVHGNHKLFSTQLERELSEFEGRGSKTPRNYLPGKSNLPKVLLTSNPLVERDLQKKLNHINYGRTRRQKVWEWNQRHFLVSQIFDPDYNLRFKKELKKYSEELSKHRRKKTEINGRHLTNDDSGNEKTSKVGYGVFMPPLHPSQRLMEKQKIPQQNKLINGMSTPNLSTKPDNESSNPAQRNAGVTYNTNNKYRGRKLSRERHIQQEDIQLHRQYTTISILHNGKASETDPLPLHQQSSTKFSNKRKVSKSVSLPDIPLHKSKTSADFESRPFTYGVDNMPLEDYQIIDQEDQKKLPYKEILCEDDVLEGITRSLPLSVMIKANQIVNREVQKRKEKMIQKCKSERDKDTFNDPRWLELNKVLVNTHTE